MKRLSRSSRSVIPAQAGSQWVVRSLRRRWIPACAGMTVIVIVAAGLSAQDEAPAVRFAAVDVMIDPHGKPLAAYQLDFRATRGNVAIVGIEGGEHAAFSKPPYYDPKAMQQERVIIAALSTNESLPTAKTRIATIHLQITGEQTPQYKTQLTAAATNSGEAIEANIILEGGL